MFDPADDDNTFFLESSSRAELEKAAHHLARFRIGAQRPSEAAFQKPHPTAHSIPYIPTPGTPFPYQIDPLAARTFSLAFQSVVNIGVRGSEHIRQRVVQAGALGVVSCILAVWLKGKGFAIGEPPRSLTDSRDQSHHVNSISYSAHFHFGHMTNSIDRSLRHWVWRTPRVARGSREEA